MGVAAGNGCVYECAYVEYMRALVKQKGTFVFMGFKFQVRFWMFVCREGRNEGGRV